MIALIKICHMSFDSLKKPFSTILEEEIGKLHNVEIETPKANKCCETLLNICLERAFKEMLACYKENKEKSYYYMPAFMESHLKEVDLYYQLVFWIMKEASSYGRKKISHMVCFEHLVKCVSRLICDEECIYIEALRYLSSGLYNSSPVMKDFLDMSFLNIRGRERRHGRVNLLIVKLNEIRDDMKNILKVHK